MCGHKKCSEKEVKLEIMTDQRTNQPTQRTNQRTDRPTAHMLKLRVLRYNHGSET